MTDSDAGLRARLVDVGVELLATDGPQALTLREIARRAGVSHGAPRRYFPTHLELLSAIARRGFTELAGRAHAALERETGGPRAQVAALARTYLEFALERPGMYELMFRHDLLESGHLGLRDSSLPLFTLLARLIGDADPGADARRAAGALWANLHGTAQLWRWRSLQLALEEEDFGPLLDTVLAAYLGGPGGGR
ncbi:MULTISPECIES: TetR/AcrR family transcriptional regulator [unclassified Streptomyces]|uniref:TetR/AcrR family transcriptional regulator n=1 Tax=unclassified Streptomyces TaxID=2593676 RepID=UPI0004C58D09|nr:MULTISPECIES: TetR/AcrR family transcriptional regulator [unclassified Streptomyces]MBG7698532.1 TetR/AcrR family transcriptional regulator [Streptomyces sp. MC1]